MYLAKKEVEKDQQVGVQEWTFMLVHQTAYQRRLLARYGALVFIDAIYKTPSFDLPLFFLVVKTNVDYQVIASFLLENETAASIEGALKVIRSSKENWEKIFPIRPL